MIAQALTEGYRVRTTVRSLDREPQVRRDLQAMGVVLGDTLTLVQADLTCDEGWVDAVADCRYVLHVASPFPGGTPKHEDELIVTKFGNISDGGGRRFVGRQQGGINQRATPACSEAWTTSHAPARRSCTR